MLNLLDRILGKLGVGERTEAATTAQETYDFADTGCATSGISATGRGSRRRGTTTWDSVMEVDVYARP